MKISFMSDFHLGYHYGKEFGEDSFENVSEAIEKSKDSDLILVLGDTFDTRIPKIDIWSRAIDLFSEFSSRKSEVKLLKKIGKDLNPLAEKNKGVPVITLHGNHERRGKGQTNIISALEKTGLILHLHLNGLVFQKGKQKVAIQGMSSVPERYAKTILDKWNPKPVDGCYNILLIHQNVEPFVYSPLDPPTLNTKNLPEGFDLIINGHVHVKNQANTDSGKFIITGSTVVTQLKEEESKIPKGFYKLKLPEKKLDFIELENTRKFFFKEIKLSENSILKDQVEKEVKKISGKKYDKKPIIKFRLLGKKSDLIEKDLRKIEKSFDDIIVKFSKKLDTDDSGENLEVLDKLSSDKLSLEETGMEILNANLGTLDFKKLFDHEIIFKLLSTNQMENAYNIVLKKQATMKAFGEKNDN